MAQKIQLPNGEVLEFPDGMSDSAMSAAISKNFPEFAPKAESPSIMDDRNPVVMGGQTSFDSLLNDTNRQAANLTVDKAYADASMPLLEDENKYDPSKHTIQQNAAHAEELRKQNEQDRNHASAVGLEKVSNVLAGATEYNKDEERANTFESLAKVESAKPDAELFDNINALFGTGIIAGAAGAIGGGVRGADTSKADSMLEEAAQKAIDFADDYQKRAKEAGVNDTLLSTGQSLGYSAVTMAPMAIPYVGQGLSFGMMYRGAQNQFMNQMRKSYEAKQGKVSDDDWAKQEQKLSEETRNYGLWEAIPEYASDRIFFGILGKTFGTKAVGNLTKKLGVTYGLEFANESLSEAATNLGQGVQTFDASQKLGVKPEGKRGDYASLGDWINSYAEVAPSVALSTAIMSGAGGAIRAASNKDDARQVELQQLRQQSAARQETVAASQVNDINTQNAVSNITSPEVTSVDQAIATADAAVNDATVTAEDIRTVTQEDIANNTPAAGEDLLAQVTRLAGTNVSPTTEPNPLNSNPDIGGTVPTGVSYIQQSGAVGANANTAAGLGGVGVGVDASTQGGLDNTTNTDVPVSGAQQAGVVPTGQQSTAQPNGASSAITPDGTTAPPNSFSRVALSNKPAQNVTPLGENHESSIAVKALENAMQADSETKGTKIIAVAYPVRDLASAEPPTARDRSWELTKKIQNIFGIKVVTTRQVGGNGSFKFHGVYWKGTNRVYMDIDAQKPAHAVFGHEFIHHLKENHNEAYLKLVETLRPMITDLQKFKGEERLPRDMTDDIVVEELLGNVSGNRMNESSFWKEVAEKSPKHFEVIVKTILELLDKIKAKLGDAPAFRGDEFITDIPKMRTALAEAVAFYNKQNPNARIDMSAMRSNMPTYSRNGVDIKQQENRSGVIVGARAGEFNWTFDSTVEPPPISHPVAITPNVERIGPRLEKILKSKAVLKLVEDLFGVTNLKVYPILGQFKGVKEPSFVLYGDGMTLEAADGISRLLGFSFAQESTIVTQPVYDGETDTWPAYYVGNGKKLTSAEISAVESIASEKGIDYSTSIDGTAFKFFFDGSDIAEFAKKINEIAAHAKLNKVEPVETRSIFNEAENYTKSGDGSGSRQVWMEDGSTGPSSLFRRTVDNLLVPYAKAVGAEGYRFSPDLFAKRFGLSEQQREYIRAALRPKQGAKLSTADIVSGKEKLELTKTSGTEKKPRSNNTDIMFGLQNRAAQNGLIEPSDHSPEAKKIISEAIADEVIHHISTPTGKSAIGWYDAALKRAKTIYHQVFPDLAHNKNKEMLFDAMLGIASQGNDVHANSIYTGRMYQLVDNEQISLSDAVKILEGTFGGETNAIENNYLKLEQLIERNGYDEMRKRFNKKMTVGEWNLLLRTEKSLWYNGKPLKMAGAARQTITGWMAFGPKIGSFINNLHGDYSTLAADLWFSRTWNRILGFNFVHTPTQEAPKYQAFKSALIAEHYKLTTPKSVSANGNIDNWEHGKDADFTDEELDILLSDPDAMLVYANTLNDFYKKGFTFSHNKADKKSIYSVKSDLRRAAKNWIEHREETQALPRSDNERAFQQETMEAAQKLIKRKTGKVISIADMQAALWYHEKELFGMFGGTTDKSAPADYADAAERFMELYNKGDLFWNESDEKYVHGTKGYYLGKQSKQARAASTSNPKFSRTSDGASLRVSPEEVTDGYGVASEDSTEVVGVHYSSEPRNTLSSLAYGRGMKGAEASRVEGNPILSKRIHFYVDEGQSVRPESAVGGHAHAINLKNIYDVNKDPLGFRRQARGSMNVIEKLVYDAGYDGVYVSGAQGSQGVAVLIGRHAVKPTYLGTHSMPAAGAYVAPVTTLKKGLMSAEIARFEKSGIPNAPSAKLSMGTLSYSSEDADAVDEFLGERKAIPEIVDVKEVPKSLKIRLETEVDGKIVSKTVGAQRALLASEQNVKRLELLRACIG